MLDALRRAAGVTSTAWDQLVNLARAHPLAMISLAAFLSIVVAWLARIPLIDLLYFIFIAPFVAVVTYFFDPGRNLVVWITALTAILLISAAVSVFFFYRRRLLLTADRPNALTRIWPAQAKMISVERLYLATVRFHMWLVSFLGSAFALLLIVQRDRDIVGALLCGGAAAVVLGYGLLTQLRMRSGWFADNKIEAEELLRFIASRAADGGLPPGTKAFEVSVTIHHTSVGSEGAAEGARA